MVDPLGLQLIENIKVFGNEKAVNEAIEYLLKSTTFAQAYEAFENSGKILKIKTITIKCKTDEMNMIYRWTEGTIYWDPSLASVFDTFNLELGSSWDDPIILGSQSPAMILAHEILHAIQHLTNPENINPFTHDPVTKLPTDPQYGNPEDRRVITGPEADIACDLGEDIRSSNRATFFKAASITSNELPKLPKLYPD